MVNSSDKLGVKEYSVCIKGFYTDKNQAIYRVKEYSVCIKEHPSVS